MTLCIFLVHCVLCCAGDFDSACCRELMGDETWSRYIFLFMLLLIPFLVIGLSTKALIYIEFSTMFNITNGTWTTSSEFLA